MSILHSKPHWEYKKSEFAIGDQVRISKYDLPFRKGFEPQFQFFHIAANANQKFPTYTIKDDKEEVTGGKFKKN